MKRPRGVHSRRAQEHYQIPSRREVIDFQKSVLKILKLVAEKLVALHNGFKLIKMDF